MNGNGESMTDRRRFRRFVALGAAALLALVLVMPVAPALAAEEHAAPAGAAADGHASKPALLDWDIGAAFWSILVFVVLLTVLRSFAWKPILDGLNRREEFIRDSLVSAKAEREQAQRQLAEYTEKLNKAREEATAIVGEGRRDAEEVKKRVVAEAKAEADAAVKRAKKDIEMARDAAVKQLHDQTIMLATSIAGKIVRQELKPQDHARLMDEALQEMGGLN